MNFIGLSLRWFIALAWLFVSLLPDAVLAQAMKRLRYGTTISTINLPVWVAKESRLFAKYGLDPEVILIQAGALTTLAIISGELQFSGAGAASVLAARIKGSDIVLVACPADSDLVYLMARPEIKTTAELKGKSSAVTRLGSTTHFYLRSALKYAGLNPEKDVTILQLGSEYAAALETGRIAAAALPFDLALPYLQRGWPLLLDLSKTDFVYPASCVVSSRAFIKQNPDTVESFLKAYIEAIHLMKKDHGAGERAYIKWLKPKDPLLAKKAVEAYANLFKPVPRVTDRGIQAVLEDLATSTAVPKDLIARPDYFRDNGPLEKIVATGWIDQLSK
jgi:ABC-type nitrate/sulfonate/bicarbonate transport system substrate-binding protein